MSQLAYIARGRVGILVFDQDFVSSLTHRIVDMSVQARTNAQGTYEYTEDRTFKTQLYVNGEERAPTFQTNRYWLHNCRKNGTKGQRILVGGVLPYRLSTTFRRYVASYTYGRTVWRNEVPGWIKIQDVSFGNSDQDYYSPGNLHVDNSRRLNDNQGLIDQCVATALSRIRDQTANLGENLATLKQTTNMFAENALLLGEACLAVRRGNYRAAWAILRDTRSVIRRGSDLFLQYKYGWKPLMSDIYNSWEKAADLARAVPLISASAKSQKLSPAFYDPYSWQQHSDYTIRRGGGGWMQARVKLVGALNGDYSRNLDRLGLANPLRLSWDLVPLSFVTDWFVPIGPCLDSLVPPKGIVFVDGYSQLRCELSGEFHYIPRGTVSGDTITNTFDLSGYERNRYVNWPKAGLYTTRDPLKVANWASAIALVTQKIFK
jgi:hypothetical protein